MIFYLIFNQAPLVIAAAIYEYKQITKQTSQFHNTCIHITSLLSAGMLHVCKTPGQNFLLINKYVLWILLISDLVSIDFYLTVTLYEFYLGLFYPIILTLTKICK